MIWERRHSRLPEEHFMALSNFKDMYLELLLYLKHTENYSK